MLLILVSGAAFKAALGSQVRTQMLQKMMKKVTDGEGQEEGAEFNGEPKESGRDRAQRRCTIGHMAREKGSDKREQDPSSPFSHNTFVDPRVSIGIRTETLLGVFIPRMQVQASMAGE